MNDASAPLLEISGLRKRFGDLEVLKGVDLSVARREVIAIIGVSGSGKSTMLRCVNLLEEPTGGAIVFDGRPVEFGEASGGWLRRGRARAALRAEIGMVFQQFNLWPHKTVLENVIEAPMIVKGVARVEARAPPLHPPQAQPPASPLPTLS